MSSDSFKFSNAVVVAPLLAILSIWIVFWVEVQFGINLNDYGVYPRRLSGLKGVLFSPFIHGSIEHLYNNTIPLAVLTAFLFYFYHSAALRVLLFGTLASGLLTWAIARPSFHIGASGVIYLLASFIFFKGILAKNYRLVALSLVVVFIYGSMIWYIFPVKDGISWEGHLAGFVTGLVFAFITKVRVPEVQKYDWEQEDFNEDDDPFLKHFDEQGNFIETSSEDNEQKIEIKYHYKESDED
ncbi:MAG TPA: rhomboid family intramembrane serine protease [Allomuricauda sp.]|nr:rhomboid family intramembrane serine protease [Allomuricauda sp.]